MRTTDLIDPVRTSTIARATGDGWEGGLARGGEDYWISSVAAASKAIPGCLTFISKAGMVDGVDLADAVVIAAAPPRRGEAAIILSKTPRLSFVKALIELERHGFVMNNEPCVIHQSVTHGHPSPFQALKCGSNVRIGARTRIDPGVVIGDNVEIGEDCWIRAGAVVGMDGFGFERDTDGTPLRMLHFGGVRIGNRVEVGALTTVCRGTLGDTVVEDDVKIDDHVHIAHNVRLRKKAMVVACAEVSGSVDVGECVWIGPNASIRDGLKIGDRAFVGIGAVVVKDVPPDVTVAGCPAKILESRPKLG